MDNSELVCGSPFGGCSILYRKSLASCITPLDSCSNCFCSVKFNCSSGLSMVFVYMPSSSSPSSFTEYLNTLGELDGFIHSYHSDVVVIVGDFNVGFDRCCQLTNLLCDFMSDHSLCSCDLLFKDDVLFTYKRDDGLCVHGLIMFFASSLSPPPYQMYVLSTLVLFFLTTFHCFLHWKLTIYLLIILSLYPLRNCIGLTGLG